MKTVDGRDVGIIKYAKQGMSVFTTFGLLDNQPCHWTKDGKFRMDEKTDPRDIRFDEPAHASHIPSKSLK